MSNPVVEIVAKVLADCDEYPDPANHPVYGEYARAVLSALENAGYKVVAREPTKKMIEAVESQVYAYRSDDDSAYGLALSALWLAHDAAPRYGGPSG